MRRAPLAANCHVLFAELDELKTFSRDSTVRTRVADNGACSTGPLGREEMLSPPDNFVDAEHAASIASRRPRDVATGAAREHVLETFATVADCRSIQ